MSKHKRVSILLLLCLFFLIKFTSPEIYSSIHSIREAFLRERDLVEQANDVLHEIGNTEVGYEIKLFRRFILKARLHHLALDDDTKVERYLTHPINIYHFIKRCVHDWRYYTQHFYQTRSNAAFEFMRDFETVLNEDNNWPRRQDLIGVSMGIIRLQATYSLDFFELSTGTVMNTHTRPLSVEDFYDIGMVAKEKWMASTATTWLEQAAERLYAGEKGGPKTVTYFKLMEKIAELSDEHGDYERAFLTAGEMLSSDPTSKTAQDLHTYYKRKSKTQTSMDLVDQVDSHPETGAYESLCRGDGPEKPASETKELRCYLSKTLIPYRPAKVELVSIDPNIYIYHDVIYPAEQDFIKDWAKPALKRSTVIPKIHAGIAVSEVRVSRNAWLRLNEDNSVMKTITTRLAQITGLKNQPERSGVFSAEDMQVVNYGVGGMYEPHTDFLNPHANFTSDQSITGPSGDRIATWLYYLNDVAHGGATVFPNVGARVPVIKGAAAFWWNMFRNGTTNPQTLHAGCPVNIGSKWIANIWFRYIPQVFNLQCTTNRLD